MTYLYFSRNVHKKGYLSKFNTTSQEILIYFIIIMIVRKKSLISSELFIILFYSFNIIHVPFERNEMIFFLREVNTENVKIKKKSVL